MAKFRRVFAVVLFCVLTYSFVDVFDIIPSRYLHYLYQTQLIPSIISSIATVSVVSVLMLVLLLLLSFLFGRVYCSFLCPFGILQDAIDRIYRLFQKRKKYKFHKPYNILRYTVFAIIVVSLVTGSILAVNISDPYSNFGRVVSNVFQPVFLFFFNHLVTLLNKLNVYSLYPEVTYPVPLFSLAFTIFMLGAIVVLVYKHGRLYCNTICPVGSFLGLISKYSIFGIRIHADSCGSCGKCLIACKAECIDIKNKYIDGSRCVACYNCLSVCEKDAIHFTGNTSVKNEAEGGRRNFFKHTAIALLGVKLLENKKVFAGEAPKKASTIPEKKKYTVSPPGSDSIEKFNSRCTACHLCVSACPTGVLRPSFLQYGLSGVNQPFMNYHVYYCNYECTVCSEVCPTGAIQLLNVENKKQTQIGKVVFEINNCVVETENTACGACSEHCPTQAVHMVPYKNGLTLPEINPDICVGCGACEYACPVRPYRAIYVEGNLIHKVAKKPEVEKAVAPDTEDFPF